MRYAYANLIYFALFDAKTIEDRLIKNFLYCQVVSSKNLNQWAETISEEIESLHKNQTWKLVRCLRAEDFCLQMSFQEKGTHSRGCRIEAPRFKAELVAKSHNYREV